MIKFSEAYEFGETPLDTLSPQELNFRENNSAKNNPDQAKEEPELKPMTAQEVIQNGVVDTKSDIWELFTAPNEHIEDN